MKSRPKYAHMIFQEDVTQYLSYVITHLHKKAFQSKVNHPLADRVTMN